MDIPSEAQRVCGQAIRARELDELLEGIWTLREQGREGVADLLAASHLEDCQKWLERLRTSGLIMVKGERVVLTPAGETEAAQILRRHRLAERLFADVFHTSEAVWEREACELEHQSVLTEEAVSAVCAFLGHPPTCPHGRSIPRGECCSQFEKEMKPFVISLVDAELASPYRIVFITPKSQAPLDRLAALGIAPGREIGVQRRRPSFVVRVGETDVALDRDIVRNIFVKQIS